ncbi:MAG TPA: prepilin-type N-terminal cleavage/methylation domain-containing protein [Polyangia bacterium]|nr:prepilin-type N-terminal cleavage/methylation domain-containing protein [Polyangia bacterium]
MGRARGFTLIELMIVVVILGILSALAMVGFKKWIGRARSAEAIAILSEMNSKEQLYKLEFAAFLPLRADDKPDSPSPDEASAAFYPLAAGSSALESARTSVSIADSTKWPQSWQSVGLRPRDSKLYCTYLTNAGAAGAATTGLKYGTILIGANNVAPWFYSLGACNLNGASGYPDDVSIFALSSVGTSLSIFNEGK